MAKAKVITFANQKGGVGKTSTCLGVGACLEYMGYKVLYIDADKQSNTSSVLRANTSFKGLYNILAEQEKANNCIQEANNKHVIAANERLSTIELLINNKIGKEYRLKESIESINSTYDYILVDTAPSLDIITINALTITNYLIVVSGADIFSINGLSDLMAIVSSVKQYTNKDLIVGGILLNRYNKRSRLNQDLKEALESMAKEYETKVFNSYIRECISIKESQVLGESITAYAPKSNAAADYLSFTQEILNDIANS